MQKQWFVLSEKFSKLSGREKYIVLFAGVFIFYLLFNAIAFETNATKTNKLQRSICTSEARICTASSNTDCNNLSTVASLASSPKSALLKSISLTSTYSSSS